MFTSQDLESLAIEFSTNPRLGYDDYEKYRKDIRNYFGDDRAFEPFRIASLLYKGDKRLNKDPDIHFLRTAIIIREAGGWIDSCVGGITHDFLETQFKKDLDDFHSIALAIEGMYLSKDKYKSDYEYKTERHKLYTRKHDLVTNLFNIDDRNEMILKIKEMYRPFGRENIYVEQNKVLSYIYSLPQERRNPFGGDAFRISYDEKSYREYVFNIVKYVLHNQINDVANQGALHGKLGDRTDNTRDLRGIDNSKIERAVKKDLIVLQAIEWGIDNGLIPDDTTVRLIYGLSDVLMKELATDYSQIKETIDWKNKINDTASKVIDTAKRIITL